MSIGGDCMATGSDAKRKATEAVAVQFARDDVSCSVRCPQRRMMKRMRWGQRTLQPPRAIVALTDEGNLNVDVAGKTPISDWRRIDR